MLILADDQAHDSTSHIVHMCRAKFRYYPIIKKYDKIKPPQLLNIFFNRTDPEFDG